MYLETIKPSHLQMSRYLGMANTNEAVWWVLVLTVKLFTDVPMPFSNAAEMVSQQSFP